MEKKTVSKYVMWFLALVAVAFAIAGLYYTGATQKVEGFFSGNAASNKERMSNASASDTGSCGVGTCG